MQITSIHARNVLGSESVTVDATSGGVSLTATKYNPGSSSDHPGDKMPVKSAFITVEDNEIRFNINPAVTVTPTANGHEAGVGTSFEIHGRAVANFRAIRTGGSSGVIRVTYFG